MRPTGTAAELERRRRRALRLLDGGHALAAVARRVGVSPSAVWRWQDAVRRDGPAGVAAKPVPGRPSKLTAAQWQRLLRILARDARLHGFPDDRWTTRRVAAVIAREFGVTYHPAHVGRLLAAGGWRCEKRVRRDVARERSAIGRGTGYRWVPTRPKRDA